VEVRSGSTDQEVFEYVEILMMIRRRLRPAAGVVVVVVVVQCPDVHLLLGQIDL